MSVSESYEGKQIVSRAEMVGKIKAAVDTRRDGDLVIIARSDARSIEGLHAAIDRVNAYLEAGADVGFVEAPQSAEELAAAARQLTKPALCNIFEGGKTPPLPARELEAMGYRIGIYPSQTHRAHHAHGEEGDVGRMEQHVRQPTVGSPVDHREDERKDQTAPHECECATHRSLLCWHGCHPVWRCHRQ